MIFNIKFYFILKMDTLNYFLSKYKIKDNLVIKFNDIQNIL